MRSEEIHYCNVYLLTLDDQVKDDDIVGTCRRYGEMRMHTNTYSINLRNEPVWETEA